MIECEKENGKLRYTAQIHKIVSENSECDGLHKHTVESRLNFFGENLDLYLGIFLPKLDNHEGQTNWAFQDTSLGQL